MSTRLILSLCFFGIALIFIITGIVIEKTEQKFYKNKTLGKAKVDGIFQSQNVSDSGKGSSHTLFVTLEGINDDSSYSCQAGIPINELRTHPSFQKGNIIDVYYMKKKILGMTFYDIKTVELVRKIENNPDRKNAGFVMYIFATAFCVPALILLFSALPLM